MNASKNKENENPINMLHDIEDIDTVLNKDELKIINSLFNSIDNFNQLTDSIEKGLIKNKLNEYQIKMLFNSIIKVANYKKYERKHEKPEKLGLTKTFFELPEIITRRILTNKNI